MLGIRVIAVVLGDRRILVVELVRGADDGGRVDGLEAVVLEFGCDETEEVGARPLLVGIPEFRAIALLVVQPESF